MREDQLTEQAPKKKSFVKRFVFRTIAVLGIVYVCILGMLVASETTLVYPGSKYPRGNWEPEFAFEELNFPSADGTEINAWILPAAKSNSSALVAEEELANREIDSDRYVLLCHGNAENVAQSAGYIGRKLQKALSANVMVFDYHGYGKVKGTPSEKVVKEDAEAALKVFCERFKIQTSDVILVGHSIGGGPAVHLATTQECRGLVVQRTFSSLRDVAQSMYWWLPVRYVMSNNFDSAEAIKDFDGPMLQSHGEIDQLIPIRFAHKLYENCPSVSKEFFSVPDMGHLDPLPKSYWSKLAEWGKSLD